MPNNQNAAKDPAELASSQLQIRVNPGDKSSWVRAAQARLKRDPDAKAGLAAWVIATLNAAADHELSRAPAATKGSDTPSRPLA